MNVVKNCWTSVSFNDFWIVRFSWRDSSPNAPWQNVTLIVSTTGRQADGRIGHCRVRMSSLTSVLDQWRCWMRNGQIAKSLNSYKTKHSFLDQIMKKKLSFQILNNKSQKRWLQWQWNAKVIGEWKPRQTNYIKVSKIKIQSKLLTVMKRWHREHNRSMSSHWRESARV